MEILVKEKSTTSAPAVVTEKLEVQSVLPFDDSVLKTSSEEDFVAALKTLQATDVIATPFINECGCVAIEPALIEMIKAFPSMAHDVCSGLKVKKNGYEITAPDIDPNNPKNAECIRDVGLFLVAPVEGKLKSLPLRPIAITSLFDRGGMGCPTMYRTDERGTTMRQALPLDEKAAWLSRAYLLYGDSCIVVMREGKVSFIGSKDYVWMPYYELLPAVKDWLEKTFESSEFLEGSLSHEYMCVKYELEAPEETESIRLRLNDHGMNIDQLKMIVQLSSSDAGIGQVTVRPFAKADKTLIPMGYSVSMPHKGEASIEKLKEVLDRDFLSCLKAWEEQIDALGNIDLNDVEKVIKAVREKYTVFDKKITEDVAASYAGAGTAIDVYIALSEIADRMNTGTQMSPTSYLNLIELVERLKKLPFEKIDNDENWEKV